MNTLERAKYRAKRIDNGEWLTFSLGDASNETDGFYVWINHYTQIHVSEETLGQFTGKQDKAGIDMFEGDKVVWGEDVVETISFLADEAMFGTETSCLCSEAMTVIGNIYDDAGPMQEVK